jgi:hypothetical protein
MLLSVAGVVGLCGEGSATGGSGMALGVTYQPQATTTGAGRVRHDALASEFDHARARGVFCLLTTGNLQQVGHGLLLLGEPSSF